MNILLIALAVILVWRVSVGAKRGVVKEVISFVNVFYVAVIIGLVCVITNAYHEKNYLAIIVSVLIIAALSIVYSILKIVFFSAKVLAKLPVVNGIDRLMGIFIGIVETVVIYWILCYAMMYFKIGTLNDQILSLIGDSELLTTLYEYNLLGFLLESIKIKVMALFI